MISRNPKYVEPKAGATSEAAKKTWFFALLTPAAISFVAFAAYRIRNAPIDFPLAPIQEQYVMFASGIVLLGVAYVANLLGKKGSKPWVWVALGAVTMLPIGAAHILRIEFGRLLMVAGSSVLIWFAVVVPAFHRSFSRALSESETIRESNGN